MKAIVNTKLIMEDGIIWDGAVLINDNGKIEEAGWVGDVTLPEGIETIDAGGKYTAPGFIDIHVHGNTENFFISDPIGCCEHFIKHGHTTILPTFFAGDTCDEMIEGAERLHELSKTGVGRVMNGLYMEGPFMKLQGGCQSMFKWDAGAIKEEHYKKLVDGIKDYVRVWAIDPHREGIEPMMAYAKNANPNVIFAIGHSNASVQEIRKVAKYGIKDQTHHVDDGQGPAKALGLKGAGGDEYTLYNTDMYAELICDKHGIHVVPDLIKVVMKVKGFDKVILITDCLPSVGDYKNDPELCEYGDDLNYDDRGWLAGSHLTLDSAVKNLMTHSGFGLCHAVRCASLNAAQMLGIDDEVGSIEKGKYANLIIMDDMINIEKVFLRGDLMVNNGD